MATPPQVFEHVRGIMSIIVGLAVATLLTGIFEFGTKRHRRFSWLHTGWAMTLVVECIVFWWWELRLSLITIWNFGTYFFILVYPILFFVLARILYPPDVCDVEDRNDYFIQRRFWFFGFLLATIVADLWDTHIKGPNYIRSLGWDYWAHNVCGAGVCVLGMVFSNRRLQLGLMFLTLGYELVYVATMYNHL